MSSTAAWLLSIAIVAGGLAGCADKPAATTSGGETVAPAPPATVSADLGSITGRVLSDEFLPIPKAQVTVRETQNGTTTDAAGQFTFNQVAPGSYTVIGAVLGYESRAVKVEVVAGEVAEVNLTLTAIAIEEPRVLVLQHTILLTACGFDAVGVCDNAATCPDCNWRLEFKDDPTYFFFEIYGRHAVTKPTGKDGLMTYAYRNSIGAGYLWNCNDLDPLATPACMELPIRMGFAAEDYKDIKTLLVYQTCEPGWFCVEEKYDDWASFFFNTDPASVPEGYTAVPDA